MIKKTFKYRIYPNKEQIKQINTVLSLCQKLYNIALEQRIFAYTQLKKTLTAFDQMNQLPELKTEFPEFKQVFSQTLQDVLTRLDKAYQNFFRRVKRGNGKAGFPRFKPSTRYTSFTFPQYKKLTFNSGRLSIPKIGDVKIVYSREIEGTPKTLTITKDADQYFICISCETDQEISKVKVKNFVGIDLGLTNLITCSDGTIVDNPRHLKKSEKKLSKHQRHLSRKTKGSNNRNRQRLLVARTHRKIKNQRRDFLHKLSRTLINKYDLIVFENLQIQNMVKNHHLAKAIIDASWNTLLQYCTYKAEEAGKYVIQVDPRMTTKTCNHCGHIQAMPLWKRVFDCENCGTFVNRDINASKNILNKYTAGIAEIYAFGENWFQSNSLKKEAVD